MRFVLHYSGPLHPNGDPRHKHEIRRVFHEQLAELWKQEPLKHVAQYRKPKGNEQDYSVLRPRGMFTFAPLVTEEMKLIAAVKITLLRPGPNGRVIVRGGDLDNRLKTLFDAMAVPPHANALPPGAQPLADEDPFFTVLEDDALITSVSVDAEHLLKSAADPSHVELFIAVQVTATSPTLGNGMIG